MGPEELMAALGGDGEARRHGQTRLGHGGQTRSLAAQDSPHLEGIPGKRIGEGVNELLVHGCPIHYFFHRPAQRNPFLSVAK